MEGSWKNRRGPGWWPRQGDVPAREISHSGPATRSHAPRRPHSLSLPGLPARPLLSLHFGPVSAPLPRSPPAFPWSVPLLQARALGLRRGCSLDALIAAQWSQKPGRAGGYRERSSTGGAPAGVAPDIIEAQGLALQPPEAAPTCLQLTSAPGLPPLYPSELLKFATRSPSRRGKKLRELPDSPPGSTRRCWAPRGPGLGAV